jgi:hypothetical protein
MTFLWEYVPIVARKSSAKRVDKPVSTKKTLSSEESFIIVRKFSIYDPADFEPSYMDDADQILTEFGRIFDVLETAQLHPKYQGDNCRISMAHFLVVQILWERGKFPAVVNACTRALANVNDGIWNFYRVRCHALIKLRKTRDAWRDLANMIQTYPGNTDIYSVLRTLNSLPLVA